MRRRSFKRIRPLRRRSARRRRSSRYYKVPYRGSRLV